MLKNNNKVSNKTVTEKKRTRLQRVCTYQDISRKIYLEHRTGCCECDSISALEDEERTAKKNQDDDYALFFDAEKEHYSDLPDYDNAISTLRKAMSAVASQKSKKKSCEDHFFYKQLGLYYIRKGDKSFNEEDFDEAIENLNTAKQIAPNNYDVLRLLGVAHYGKKEYDKAIEFFDKSIEIEPTDYLAFTNYGNALLKKEKIDDAIVCYNKSLEIEKNDYDTLYNLGIAYCKKEEYDDAIKCFDKVLKKTKNKEINALIGKGYALYRQKKYEDAIICYEDALLKQPNDPHTKFSKGLVLFSMAKDVKYADKSADLIFESLLLAPRWRAGDFVKICQQRKTDPIEFLSDKQDVSPEIITRVKFHMNLVDKFQRKSQEYQDLITKEKSHYNKTLVRESRMPAQQSLLMFLRKWNSYTPAIPVYNRTSVGGGYFLWHRKTGSVIDPGYNFLENFYRAGGSIADIDNIIITHSHDDHTIQLEQIISLLIKYNDEQKPKSKKKVHFYLSLGTFQKFAGIIDLTNELFGQRYTILNVSDTVSLFDANGKTIGKLKVLPTYHFEICSHDYGVGLLFNLENGKGDSKNILMTSDTALVPLEKNEKTKAIPRLQVEESEYIYRRYMQYYGDETIDLMLLHIGSIKAGEMLHDDKKLIKDIVKEHIDANLELNSMNTNCDSDRKSECEQKRDGYYPNHLGWLGVREVISHCNPKVAVISEWGEELKHFRCDLTQQLELVVNHYVTKFQDNPMFETPPETPRVIPGDLSLVYNIFEESFFNATSSIDDSQPKEKTWVSYKHVDFMPADENDPRDLYFFDGKIDAFMYDEEKRHFFIDNREAIVDCFLHNQKHRKKLWFEKKEL